MLRARAGQRRPGYSAAIVRLLVPALACLCLLGAPGAARAQQVHISASPSLQPPFDPAVTDYVTRCGGGPVRFTVTGAPDRRVAVDGDARREGTFTTTSSLAAGQSLSLVVSDAEGTVVRTHHVRCLPADFPAFTAVRTGQTQAQWYIVAPSLAIAPPRPGTSVNYVAIFDRDGAPAWWSRSPAVPADAKLLPNGHIAWGLLPGGMREVDLGGQLVRSLNTVGVASDLHDLQLLPNGNYLLMAYRPVTGVDLSPIGGPADAEILDSHIQELEPDGTLVWSWNASEHIDVSEIPVRWRAMALGSGMFGASEVYHLNSVEPDGDGLVLSFRFLDAVYRIDRGTGAVDWKLGGAANAGQSLTVVGDPRDGPNGPIAGQHDARILPGGDLTIQDNGAVPDGAGGWIGPPPRAVRYAIDTTARTATRVEEVTDPRVPLSFCCGSARRLAGGNWVMGWGGDALTTELTPGGQPVFSLAFAAPLFSYRADPVPPGALSTEAVRAGMDLQHPRRALALGGASGAFGTVSVGTGSRQEFTVANPGTQPVAVSQAIVSGTDGAHYTVEGQDCAGRTLAPGQTCGLAVTYAPSSAGSHAEATLQVLSNAASSPNDATLSAMASAPAPGPGAPEEAAPSPPAAATAPPAGRPPQRPSNSFAFPSLSVDGTGTVRATVRLPGAGSLEALQTARRPGAGAALLRPALGTVTIARTVRRARRSGRMRIALRLNRTGRGLVRARGGRLRARLTLRFTPTGGTPRSGWRELTILVRRG